jgi:hypothetical protein
VARAQQWISLSACSAQSTDEIEFRAALQGLQLAARLELLTTRRSLRIVSNRRTQEGGRVIVASSIEDGQECEGDMTVSPCFG